MKYFEMVYDMTHPTHSVYNPLKNLLSFPVVTEYTKTWQFVFNLVDLIGAVANFILTPWGKIWGFPIALRFWVAAETGGVKKRTWMYENLIAHLVTEDPIHTHDKIGGEI
jgi:hypothetical protein